MSDLFVPRVGAVLSADIAVPEHEREVRWGVVYAVVQDPVGVYLALMPG